MPNMTIVLRRSLLRASQRVYIGVFWLLEVSFVTSFLGMAMAVQREKVKQRFLMSDLVPHGHVGLEAFNVFLHYMYTGKLKPSSPEVSTCVDDSRLHDACRPAINYALELMYASATVRVKELVLLVQRHLLNFIEKALPEDVIPIVIAAYHCQLNLLLSQCIQIIVRSDLDNTAVALQPWCHEWKQVGGTSPHCSAVLDNYLDDDMPDVLYLEKGTPEEREVKKMRFMELKGEVQKAFYKDIAEDVQPDLTSSSSSSLTVKEGGMNRKVRRK